MSRVIIGTYRRHAHIEACLSSMDAHLGGVSDVVFIDDSGDDEFAHWLMQYGRVVALDRQGYSAAMRTACAAAQGNECFWLEEDFTFVQPVHLDELSETLYHRPYLAQVALLRGPHFEIEHRHGGLLEALVAQGHVMTEVNGVIEQTATFTSNPSLWRGEIWASGWPQGDWTEEQKRVELIAAGYRFGFLPGIKVNHTGIRSGHGY